MRIQQTVRYIHPFPLLPQAGNYVTTTVWVGLVGFSISSASPTESDRSCISSRPPGQTRPWKYRDAWGDSFFCFRLDESGAASGWLTGRPHIIPHSGRGGRKLHKKALLHFAGKVSSLHPKKSAHVSRTLMPRHPREMEEEKETAPKVTPPDGKTKKNIKFAICTGKPCNKCLEGETQSLVGWSHLEIDANHS